MTLLLPLLVDADDYTDYDIIIAKIFIIITITTLLMNDETQTRSERRDGHCPSSDS